MRLNNRGYMLIEIIIAFTLTITIATYIINMTIKLKTENTDMYEEQIYISTSTYIKENIMNDLQFSKVSEVEQQTNDIIITLSDNSKRKIHYDPSLKKIMYCTIVETGTTCKPHQTDKAFFMKKIDNSLNIGTFNVESDANSNVVKIPLNSPFTEKSYDIKLMFPK